MEYVIGVDAGGTKTEANAYNLEGQVVGRSCKGFGNLLNDKEKALCNIKSALAEVIEKLGHEKLKGIYIGSAGSEVGDNARFIKEFINSEWNTRIEVMNDAEIALKAMLKGNDGILAIAGTGSIVFGTNKECSAKCGGWGNLLGDEGSGYRVVMDAIQRMIKEEEEGLSRSEMHNAILKKLDIDTVNEVTEFVYSSTKDEIASLAPIIARLGEKGDSIAEEILIKEGIEFAKTVEKLYMKLNFDVCSIALVGGVLKNAKVLRNAFQKYLSEKINLQEIIDEEVSPSKGAYYIYLKNKNNY